MVTFAVCTQPFASVTVTVKLPALRPETVAVVRAGIVFQA